MNVTSMVRFAAVCLLLGLGACGGGDGGDEGAAMPPPPPPPLTGIGPAGGTVVGPNGAKVEIPPGALATNIDIKIELTSAGAPALPAGLTTAGQMFAFTPHGTTFAVPVTMTLPFDPASVPAGAIPAFYKTINAQTQWEQVANATLGANALSAEVTSFSLAVPLQPIERKDPNRQWTSVPDHDITTTGPLGPDGEPLDLGGEIHEIRSFGENGFFVFDDDETRTLEAFSSADGVTFWVSAEDVGHIRLRQSQKFIKLTQNATLRFVVTQGLLEAIDENQIPSADECPRGLGLSVCRPMLAVIRFGLEARTPLGELLLGSNGAPALDTVAYINLIGRANLWEFTAGNDGEQSTTAWKLTDFELTKSLDSSIEERHPRARLLRPLVFNVDLSRLKVGDDFRVIANMSATASNARERESALGAYVRDPAKTGGGAMEFTGLLPIGDPSPAPLVPRSPTPCSTGPDPAAGVLQFSAPSYALLEAPFAGLSSSGIFVTRTEGSTGVVSARVSTGGGTAVPGARYTPLSTTVNFSDGDTEPRLVSVEILLNTDNEPDTTVNLTLSEPGGCATLGAQSSAVLTILDDDRAPPQPQPSGLDASFGTGGKVTTQFGGDDTAMALQPDGKIVIVGGSTSDFELARFNANGTLDDDFGSHGRVVTSILSGITEEIARAVAIQPDGKIVVGGFTGQFGRPGRPAGNRFDHMIVRYNANGSVDTTFGNGGVASSLIGRIFAMALQPDGGIIVVGDAPLPEDMMVARYDANGNLDLTFGEGGFRLFDLSLGAELAENVAVQSNGAILVSGPHTNAGDIVRDQHTALVRLNANGTPDSSFGTGGQLILNNTRVGDGLALQPDGRIVLVGDVDGASATATQFAVMRLNSDGTPDNAFGNAGRVNTEITTLGDAAHAVALQADGKIIVAGHSSGQTNPNFAVVRYNANGTIDANFGTAGMLTIEFFGFTDVAENVAVQPDGKVVLSGVARNNVDGYGLARVVP